MQTQHIGTHGRIQMGTPIFFRSKRDGTVFWISDLRELNKVIKWKILEKNLPGYENSTYWNPWENSYCPIHHLLHLRKMEHCAGLVI